MGDLERLYVPRPRSWSNEASKYLPTSDEEIRGFDTQVITKIREAIDRLRELRTALISAAVTGRIDVQKEAE